MTNNYISLRHIFLYFCLLTGIKAFAYDAKINGIYYNFSGDKATVTYQSNQNGSYISDYSGSMVIPASVTYNGKTYSVTSIDNGAFRYCNSLTDVYCYAESVPNTHGWAFVGSNIINTTLHVPAASIKAYSTTAPWNGFGSIVPQTDEDAIESVTPDPSPVGEGSWYDILGRCTNKPAKGINILRMSDDTTKKVLRK